MISPWIVSTVALALISSVSCFFALRFAKVILRFEDAVESSLEVLDENFEVLSKILDTPLFYKSPEVKRAIDAIGNARNAILYTANSLTTSEPIILEASDAGDEEIGD
ncbi:hypothetical protein OAA09_00405 [bacterium]|nr:hypothetical protein [bacterium]